MTAVTIVARCRNKSIPLAFCLPKSCSAPPEIAPDNPALFPDCSTIKMIITIASITSKTFINVAKTPTSSLKTTNT